MSEELVIKQCSPTLAGLKTGSLFSCRADSYDELIRAIRIWNRELSDKGIRVLILRYEKGRGLVYFYRPKKLQHDFMNEHSREILIRFGYAIHNPDKCVAQLSKKFKESVVFPHEIGLFLGYPPEDVEGFIQNRAGGSQFTGYWKVYGDPERAKKIFEQYRKCTEVYQSQFEKGRGVKKLAVTV